MCRDTNTTGECIGYLFVYNLWIVQSYRKDKYKQYILMVWSATCVKYVNWEENELMLTATDTNLTSFGARQNIPKYHVYSYGKGLLMWPWAYQISILINRECLYLYMPYNQSENICILKPCRISLADHHFDIPVKL